MRDYKKRERRQVSFNTEDAVELELLRFADREDINFSGLVKNLLFAYCMGQLNPQPLSASASPANPSVGAAPHLSVAFEKIKASGMPFDF
ncbi:MULTISPECIES: hypothetical protein [Thermoactinomyces]|jgi:hypothetical protein|uniref:Uncharacterized protein n=1 Tax=Thermoactinomyces daqus TaxID=1329516 RepID=A0A7W1X882_9BACL|nr:MULTISPECIES: hypothetical protein [Thermoactinomyces]MBA4541883.1 hypothetical protein [Thermoactinomyces daqus]MBH8597882.1 hypothetical protein [Thermoactinomyces sp. CICC 10523]MBH8604234.1 hypothetical protein [Thermoactinomyces sp. CICC 10522]MBH8608044.1 hypothetical protein [Thermoactinomyces sp. CICC 10521]